ncbi:hypothetical protein BB560_006757 [Smittium megazygosporum]|uniref:Uncharacterized protein n=1 Tax=Smittium megazygosporum TaxID=133381 RepID=A0A2T9Y1X0_9FUNG|nr:hypothetical protein BB560_006757 [Smittium megazygosporum]
MAGGLTKHDSDILEAIMTGGLEGELTREDLLGSGTKAQSSSLENITSNLASEVIPPEILQKEKEAVKLAEEGNLEEARDMLSQIIKEHPRYASAYNNRAQVYRLLKDDQSTLADLDKAILEGKSNIHVLSQAYTQRAIVKRSIGDENGCLSDYTIAAELGNEVAKLGKVQENPFAKMCNTAVLKMMQDFKPQSP